jgi:hypothetical protein
MPNHFRQATLLASLAALGFSVYTYASRPLANTQEYDPTESIAKLTEIGRALQIYRQEYGVKPVSVRRSFSDAGLPPNIFVLAHAGHKWSLATGYQSFKLSNAVYLRSLDSSFLLTYRKYEEPDATLNSFFSSRGERLPILLDMNPTPRVEHAQGRITAYALRLDGTVELIAFDRHEPFAALSK